MMKRDSPTLPKRQLFILALCRFAEPIALTSVYPFLPEMIESFGVPTDRIAQWAGTTSAVFSIAQALTGIWWGRASDVYGRKPTILVALTCTMLANVLFGFSKTLLWATLARAFAGLANGNVGIIRTTVAELVPQRSLQPRAFSIMPMVWQVGSILGPVFGGGLVHPNEHFPAVFHDSPFFRHNPFSLPGLLAALIFLVGLSAGVLFLHETLEDKKRRKDYGLILGSALTESCSKCCRRAVKPRPLSSTDRESRPLLHADTNREAASLKSDVASLKKTETSGKASRYRDVFSLQSSINLAGYALLAMHSTTYDQFIPVFMHHPQQQVDDPHVQLPLKFAGGFGINSAQIGVLFTVYGLFGLIVQFTIFPPIARKVGVLRCLRWTVVGFPVIYFLTPFTSLLPTQSSKQAFMLALMLWKGWLCVFAFPCSTIMLTNSAASLKILGTLNGVSISISALGRAAGPALIGIAFTLGVRRDYMIAPWWLLTLIAVLAALPIFWLVEMDGFGDDDRHDDDDDDDDDHAHDTDVRNDEQRERNLGADRYDSISMATTQEDVETDAETETVTETDSHTPRQH